MSILNSFSNIFKRKENETKEKCIHIKLAFEKISRLLKRGIIDFSLIINLIDLLHNHISNIINNNLIISNTINYKDEKKEIYHILRKYFKYLFKDILHTMQYSKEKSLNEYYYLTNSLNFYIILLINYPDKIMIETMFEPNSNFLDYFFKCLKISLAYQEQHDATKILFNFCTSEFITIFSDSNITELYSLFKEKLLKLTLNSFNFQKFRSKDYKNLIKHILVLEFDLKNIIREVNICSEIDKPISKKLKIILKYYIFS